MQIKGNKKTLYILIILITLAFLGMSLFTFSSNRKRLRNEILNSSLPLLSENIYSEIRSNLSLPINVSSAMARDSFLVNWVLQGESDLEDITLYLNNLKEQYAFFSTFFVSEKTHHYYYYDGILKKISPDDEHDIWYFKFLESNKMMDLDVDSNEADKGILTIFINYRMKDFSGNLLGVVGVGIKLNKVSELLRKKQNEYNRDIYLVDELGIVQVHTDISLVEKIKVLEKDGLKEVVRDLMSKSSEPVERVYMAEDGNIMISSRFMPELGWYVFVEQNEDASFIKMRSSLFATLLLIIVASIALLLLSWRIIKDYENHMELVAGTDNLTQIANRRELLNKYKVYQQRAESRNRDMSMLIIDLDHFKQINDTLGHLVGDELLKQAATHINESIRPSDLLVRWGGDEFVVIMEASKKDALEKAERIRTIWLPKVQNLNEKILKNVTLSIGVASYHKGDNLDDLIHKADSALYSAKRKGKNRVFSK